MGLSFMKGEGTGQLVLHDTVARESAIRSNAATRGSMVSDDDVLTLTRSCASSILRVGAACGLGVLAHVISNELQNAAKSGKSKSLCAYAVCRKALDIYSQESGIGKFFYIVNSRLRRVKSIENPSLDSFMRAVTESCGDLADFVRLVWEGLNFEFPETPKGEVFIFRGVELPASALESYRNSVGTLIAWSMFSSFTEKREEAEEYGRA
jgi:hypothetical protein